MSFLKAEWRQLAIANYEIDRNILTPYLPAKTELDQWNGITYVSLIGFMFKDTKMLGLKIPFHINFEEVNLRFYVRYKEEGTWKRGVVFITEFVPKPAITLVANSLYHEHYKTAPMRHQWQIEKGIRKIRYEWKYAGAWHRFSVEASNRAVAIVEDSEEEFITEHYWGYTRVNAHKTFEYEVTHPRWEIYPVENYHIEVDFGVVYGDPFSMLSEQTPKSVMLAEGSTITVENKRTI